MISLDCEATGLDLYHGAKPFLVTICEEGKEPRCWEWFVDPLTRQPDIAEEDAKDILLEMAFGPRVAMQNGKYDVAALAAGGIVKNWNWSRTEDTLIAGHLLASNHPHNLTDMVMEYLEIDILPYERALEDACKEARKYCRLHLPKWKIAKEGLPGMPSVKGTGGSKKGEKDRVWKNDSWLPRALAKELKLEEDHPWWTVCAEYANADSFFTLRLWQHMEKELKRRDLWEHYLEGMKLQPILLEMEQSVVTVSCVELAKLKKEYAEESLALEAVCVGIAADHGYELELPKSGRNRSLDGFVWDVLGLEKVYQPKGKSTGPTLDAKVAIPHYLETLDAGSDGLAFIKALAGKRKRDTSVGYLETYEKFWLPIPGVDPRRFRGLHSSINQTGSDTLRFSVSNPNLTQVSKQETQCQECQGEGCDLCDGTGEDLHSVRRVFGPAPGREWWTCDAANIELRLPAYEAEEKELIALFEKPNDPPYYGSEHLLNFSTVYPDIWERELAAVGPEKVGPHCKKKYKSTNYQWCKNGDFAVGYGAMFREGGTADRSFRRNGAHAKLLARFSKKERLSQRWIAYANKHGYVETMPDGSITSSQGYPLLCTRSARGDVLPTVPLNYHTQGTAMWWMRKAMVRCHAKLKEWQAKGFDGRMVLQVHDELVFDFPKRGHPVSEKSKSNLWRIEIIRKLMEQGGDDIGVPTPVTVEYHPVSWAEGVQV